jgi:hypothetical protein
MNETLITTVYCENTIGEDESFGDQSIISEKVEKSLPQLQ